MAKAAKTQGRGDWKKRLLSGDRKALARAISAVEDETADAGQVLAAAKGHTGKALLVGFTGAPGVGKSTLLSAYVRELRKRNLAVGVVAVDPTSPVSGGAILGDRVRMAEHSRDEGVFVRSLASRGHLGGLTRTAAQVVDVMDAAGREVIVVETVGTGQSEVEVSGLVRTNVVVCTPGMGDMIQALKAGVLETAHVLVVNKADMPLAGTALNQLREALAMSTREGWQVPVLSTTATTGEGVGELADAIEAHGRQLKPGKRKKAAAASAQSASGGLSGEDLKRLAGRDRFNKLVGVEFVAGGPGRAVVRIKVKKTHLNFHGYCHGGVIFTLADAAFGLANNSRGAVSVAISVHLTFANPVREGDELTATATEITRRRRISTYRIEVELAGGTPVSTFTGTAYSTGETVDR